MSLKIVYNKNIHLYKGKKDISEVSAYTKSIYPEIAQLPLKFTYIDEDSDEITVSCNDDLEALFEFQKIPKINVSLPQVIPAFKLTQAIKITQEELNKPSEKELKKQKEEEARLQQEKLMKEREQKRKEWEEKRKQQIEKFFQDCKKDKKLSKRMTHFQKKLKEKMPEIQKFLERDFVYEGSSSSSSNSESEEEEKEEKKEQNCPMFFPWARMFGQNQGQQWWKGCGNWGKWGQKCHQKNSSTKTEEGKTIHRRYACDGCRQCPIIGDRYERTDHTDFDFCESCYNSETINTYGQEVFRKVEEYEAPNRYWKKQQFRCQQRKNEQEKLRKEKEEKEQLKKEQEEKAQEPQVELRVRKLAEEVSQILGNKEEAYYKICELYKNESVNFIVDQIFNSPEQYETMNC